MGTVAVTFITWTAICVIVNTIRYRSLKEGIRVTFTGKPAPAAREKVLSR